MKKIQKYVDGQGRTLHFQVGNLSYMVSDVPGEGETFTYGLYVWHNRQRENMYFDTASDLADAMKNISGDLRKWHVCPQPSY